MTCILKQLSPSDGHDIYDMLQRIPADETGACMSALVAGSKFCRSGHQPVSINRQTQGKYKRKPVKVSPASHPVLWFNPHPR